MLYFDHLSMKLNVKKIFDSEQQHRRQINSVPPKARQGDCKENGLSSLSSRLAGSWNWELSKYVNYIDVNMRILDLGVPN